MQITHKMLRFSNTDHDAIIKFHVGMDRSIGIEEEVLGRELTTSERNDACERYYKRYMDAESIV